MSHSHTHSNVISLLLSKSHLLQFSDTHFFLPRPSSLGPSLSLRESSLPRTVYTANSFVARPGQKRKPTMKVDTEDTLAASCIHRAFLSVRTSYTQYTYNNSSPAVAHWLRCLLAYVYLHNLNGIFCRCSLLIFVCYGFIMGFGASVDCLPLSPMLFKLHVKCILLSSAPDHNDFHRRPFSVGALFHAPQYRSYASMVLFSLPATATGSAPAQKDVHFYFKLQTVTRAHRNRIISGYSHANARRRQRR